jgi:hypothetical protein
LWERTYVAEIRSRATFDMSTALATNKLGVNMEKKKKKKKNKNKKNKK